MKAVNLKHTLPLTILILGLLFSCNRTVDSTDELKAYVQKEGNGLVKEKQVGDISVKTSFRPTDMLVAQHLGQQKASPALVDSLRQNYGQFAYFMLSLSANGREIEAYRTGSQELFSERMQTLAFGMENHVQLLTDTRDTIPMIDYTYQRTFSMGPSSDLLFAFDKEQMKKADWVQFRLTDFGLGIGNNQFKFEADELMNAPTLNFN